MTTDASFDDRGEPLVETPVQALSAFALNGLDALAIGPLLIAAPRTSPSQRTAR